MDDKCTPLIFVLSSGFKKDRKPDTDVKDVFINLKKKRKKKKNQKRKITSIKLPRLVILTAYTNSVASHSVRPRVKEND